MFVIVGHKDKTIEEGGINFVVINAPLYSQIKTFQNAFPGVEFVCMKDVNARMNQEFNNSMTKNNSYVDYSQLVKTNDVFYDIMNTQKVIG